MASAPGTHVPPQGSDSRLLGALREALRRADFTVGRLESQLGVHDLSVRRAERIVHRHRLRDESPFAALARLFLLGDPVDARELTPALSGVGVEGLEALGLATAEGNSVQATVMLVPHGDYYLVCDSNAPEDDVTPFDYVPGVQAPSVTLAKLAVRRAAESALDLGTGSGLQALLAAKHCRNVVATDINQRALEFARFNARLNDVPNIELRHGATFEPVAGERFDLIVSNPPYVVSPDHAYAYRDSDVPGDELCRRIVRGLPAHLTDGGIAHVLVSWTHAAGAAWDGPLREWVAGSGCDAWLLHYRTSDPIEHASGWLRPIGEQDPDAFKAALDRWLAYLHERRIDSVSYGAVVLRRRDSGPNWVRAERIVFERLEPAGEHLERAFRGTDVALALEDESLLHQRLRLTDQHRLTQTLQIRDHGFETTDATLEVTDGLRFGVGIDRYTLLLLPHLDGERSLEHALGEAAAHLDLTEDARRRFVPAALPVIRRLLELGCFEIPNGPEA